MGIHLRMNLNSLTETFSLSLSRINLRLWFSIMLFIATSLFVSVKAEKMHSISSDGNSEEEMQNPERVKSRILGQVISQEDGLPLPGVNVVIQERSGIGTITDSDGKFLIEAVKGEHLIFKYLGFTSKTVTANAQQNLRVVLEQDAQMLDEVVAIGYGTMRKSDLTGSVVSVKSDQLQKTPASGLDQALQGRAAGVTVNTNSGQPGASATIRIRGIGTVNNSSPIFVVDGTIVGDISFLSPNDIASTEILKDASATAIYGSRGANGVILVTTHKGKKGESKISFNAYTGAQNRWRKLDLMQRDEFAKTIISLNNLASEKKFFNNQGFNKWLQAYRLGKSPYYPVGLDYSQIETDWQEEVFRQNAPISNYHLSVDGGTEKDQYAISASYFNQDGTIIGSNYERLTLRMNSSHQVRKWFKVEENLVFMNSTGRNAMNNNSSPGASILSAALAMAPWDPVRYPDGSANVDGKDLSNQISASSNFRNVTNPFSMVENSVPENRSERWVGDLAIVLSPFKGLTLRSAISMDLSNQNNRLFKYAYEYSSYDKADKNFISNSSLKYKTLTYENTLNYQQKTGKHSFNLLVGQTTEEFNYAYIGGSGASILNPTPNNWYVSQATDDRTYANDGASRTRMFSLLGRLHYSYADRYLFTANFRGDASSKFPENLWGYFPSTAFAWRISDEPWMKDMTQIDHLKLRAGWGQIGNDKIASDNFILKMFNSGPTFVDYVLGQDQQLANGATVLTYVNQGGKWETTEQWNVGMDFGLFNNLISGNADFFVRDTKEMLLSVKAPAQVGNRYDPVANVGTVRNQGVELTLEHHGKKGKLSYDLSGNVSFVENRLTALNGGDRVYGDRSISDEGYPLYTFWGYQYDGIYKSDDEALTYLDGYTSETIPFHAGDARYADLNLDGIISDADKKNIGNPFPWLTYGFNAGVNYGNFDLQLFLQGVSGNKIYNALRTRTEGKGVEATLGTQMRNVWTTASPYGDIPNPYGTSLNFETSSRFVESGAYLRLKNIQLGYSLPKTLINEIGIQRIRLYLTGSNLLTLTPYTGYDPEVGNGVDYGNYPQSRTLMFGVNAEF